MIAAHHSALDAQRRRAIEAGLKSGEVRAVITSTSLELGVDIGTADLTVQVGLPGGVRGACSGWAARAIVEERRRAGCCWRRRPPS